MKNRILTGILLFALIFGSGFADSVPAQSRFSAWVPGDALLSYKLKPMALLNAPVVKELLKLPFASEANSFIAEFSRKTGLNLEKDIREICFFTAGPDDKYRSLIIIDSSLNKKRIEDVAALTAKGYDADIVEYDFRGTPVKRFVHTKTKKEELVAAAVGEGLVVAAERKEIIEEMLALAGKTAPGRLIQLEDLSDSEISAVMVTNEKIRAKFASDPQQFHLALIKKLKLSIAAGVKDITARMLLEPLDAEKSKLIYDSLQGLLMVNRMTLSSMKLDFLMDLVKIEKEGANVKLTLQFDLSVVNQVMNALKAGEPEKKPEYEYKGRDMDFIMDKIDTDKGNSGKEPTKEELDAIFNDIETDPVRTDFLEDKLNGE